MITLASAIRIGVVLAILGAIFAVLFVDFGRLCDRIVARLLPPAGPAHDDWIDGWWTTPAADLTDETDEAYADVRAMLPDHTGGAA